MPTLKSRTETIIRVQYYDLDSFIQEVTGQKDYECVAGEEWGNDSEHRFNIDGKLSEFDKPEWDKFKAGNGKHNYMMQTILDGLCADGHIPAGTYLVSVSW